MNIVPVDVTNGGVVVYQDYSATINVTETTNNNENKDDTTKKHTTSEIMNGAQGFIDAGKTETNKLSETDVINLSNTIYNVLLVTGIIIALIVGVILGIKFITEGAEGKAEVSKSLIPYVIGCIVVFGAFTIWKVIVTILNSVEGTTP